MSDLKFLFHSQLLRLKCEAYSTLNEEDEDPVLEGRVSEKLGKAHPHPPKVGLLDPAALYLTAILESVLFFISAILLEPYHSCRRSICEYVITFHSSLSFQPSMIIQTYTFKRWASCCSR